MLDSLFKSPWEKAAKNTAADWLDELKKASDRLALIRTVEARQTYCHVCQTNLEDGPHADDCAWYKEVNPY